MKYAILSEEKGYLGFASIEDKKALFSGDYNPERAAGCDFNSESGAQKALEIFPIVIPNFPDDCKVVPISF